MGIDNVVNGANRPAAVEFELKATHQSDGLAASMDKKDKAQDDPIFDKQDIEQKVDSLNKFLQPVRTNLKFELHEKLDRYYVSVIDSITHEVVKEIPPKKMLDMYAEMADFMGFLVDKRI